MKTLKIAIIITLLPLVALAKDMLNAYSMCKQYPFIPSLVLSAGYKFDKLEYDIKNQPREDIESSLGVHGPSLSAKLKVGNGLVYGNVNYIEVSYLGTFGKTNSSSKDSIIDNSKRRFEINFYEYGMEYEYINYFMIGFGYQEWERNYKDISYSEMLKNPYFQIGVAYGTPFNSYWWGVVEAKGVVAPSGKIDATQGVISQTLDQDLSYGYKVGFPIYWLATKNITFTFKPTVESWINGKSETLKGFRVEEARSIDYTVGLYISYNFFNLEY